MGDEVRRTPRKQQRLLPDNDTSWFDWSGLDKHGTFHRFTRLRC
jgi:glycogen operon protein